MSLRILKLFLGFLVSARDPTYVPSLEDWEPVPLMSDGAPDYAILPSVNEMVPSGEPWGGIYAPTGGILNLTLLQEIDGKNQHDSEPPTRSCNETAGSTTSRVLKPLVQSRFRSL